MLLDLSMKTPKDIALTDYKYFIVQENCTSAVGIISDQDDVVYFCNLTLQSSINALTGKIEYKLSAKPETAVRSCANPEYKEKVQQGIFRSMIDLVKDPAEVERHLLYFQNRNLPALS